VKSRKRRTEEAIKANPKGTGRQIAKEANVHPTTVMRNRDDVAGATTTRIRGAPPNKPPIMEPVIPATTNGRPIRLAFRCTKCYLLCDVTFSSAKVCHGQGGSDALGTSYRFVRCS